MSRLWPWREGGPAHLLIDDHVWVVLLLGSCRGLTPFPIGRLTAGGFGSLAIAMGHSSTVNTAQPGHG